MMIIRNIHKIFYIEDAVSFGFFFFFAAVCGGGAEYFIHDS